MVCLGFQCREEGGEAIFGYWSSRIWWCHGQLTSSELWSNVVKSGLFPKAPQDELQGTKDS